MHGLGGNDGLLSPIQCRFRGLMIATRQVAYAQNREWRLLRRALCATVPSVYPHMRPSTLHPVPRSCLRLQKVHIVRPLPRYDGRITCPCVKPYGISAQTRKAQASSITTSVQGGMWGDARMAARRLAWERLARSLLSCVSSSHRSNSSGPNRSRGSISRTTR